MQTLAAGKTKGAPFTLIELGVVLLLMALMIALVAPRAGRIPRAVAVRSLMGTVESAFRDAALRARASGQPVRLRADPSENCLRFSEENADSAATGAAQDSPPPPPLQTRGVRQKYEFPANTKWQFDPGPGSEADPERAEALYVFYPGGEASGPDMEIVLRKQTFRIRVDPLTGRAVVTEQPENG